MKESVDAFIGQLQESNQSLTDYLEKREKAETILLNKLDVGYKAVQQENSNQLERTRTFKTISSLNSVIGKLKAKVKETNSIFEKLNKFKISSK